MRNRKETKETELDSKRGGGWNAHRLSFLVLGVCWGLVALVVPFMIHGLSARLLAESSAREAQSLASRTPPPEPPEGFQVYRDGSFGAYSGRMANGLEVVLLPTSSLPLVYQGLFYRTGGSLYDPPYRSGLAHLVEHVMFHGTPALADFSGFIAQLGGQDNGFTTKDYAGYYQIVPAEHLGQIMQAEADRMVALQFDPVSFEKEKKIVLQERRERVEQSRDALFFEQLETLLYPASPYGRPTIGWRHELERLTLEDARLFYQAYYRPENAILVLSGFFDPHEAAALVQKFYGTLRGPDSPDSPGSSSESSRSNRSFGETIAEATGGVAVGQGERRLRLVHPEVRQPLYLIYIPITPAEWPEPPGGARLQDSEPERTPLWDELALELLAFMLDRETNPLSQELVFDRRVALSAGGFFEDKTFGQDFFAFYAVPAPDENPGENPGEDPGEDLDQLASALQAAVQTFLAEPLSQADLTKALRALRAELLFAHDSFIGPARLIGEALAQGHTIEDIEFWERDLEALTLGHLHRVQAGLLEAFTAPAGSRVEAFLERGE